MNILAQLTRFEAGQPYKVVVRLHDGSTHEMSFPTKFWAELFIADIPGFQVRGELLEIAGASLVPEQFGSN